MEYNIKNIQKNNDIGRVDFKDILLEDLILNDTEGESYPNLRKWLRYQLFQSKDADIILKKSDVTLELGWYTENITYKKRYLDCIFSMNTHLKMLLKIYNKKSTNYAWTLIYFDNIFNEKNMKEFCLKNGIELEELRKCFYELEIFAKNTNTLGNYMPVPDANYNATKGFINKCRYNDRIELLINDLFSDKCINNNYRSWFNNDNIRKLCLIELFKNIDEKIIVDELLDFNPHKKREFAIDDIHKFRIYLEFVNKWIENRTTDLIKKINEK